MTVEGSAQFEAIMLSQLKNLQETMQGYLEEQKQTRREISELRQHLTETSTIIRGYNGLQETVQEHDKALAMFEAYRSGYDESQNEVQARVQTRSLFWLNVQKWGALTVSVVSAAAAVIAVATRN